MDISGIKNFCEANKKTLLISAVILLALLIFSMSVMKKETTVDNFEFGLPGGGLFHAEKAKIAENSVDLDNVTIKIPGQGEGKIETIIVKDTDIPALSSGKLKHIGLLEIKNVALPGFSAKSQKYENINLDLAALAQIDFNNPDFEKLAGFLKDFSIGSYSGHDIVVSDDMLEIRVDETKSGKTTAFLLDGYDAKGISARLNGNKVFSMDSVHMDSMKFPGIVEALYAVNEAYDTGNYTNFQKMIKALDGFEINNLNFSGMSGPNFSLKDFGVDMKLAEQQGKISIGIKQLDFPSLLIGSRGNSWPERIRADADVKLNGKMDKSRIFVEENTRINVADLLNLDGEAQASIDMDNMSAPEAASVKLKIKDMGIVKAISAPEKTMLMIQASMFSKQIGEALSEFLESDGATLDIEVKGRDNIEELKAVVTQ